VFVVNGDKFVQFYENDGFRCCVFALKNYIEYLTNANATTANSSEISPKISTIDEMIIKALINLIYTTLYSYEPLLTRLASQNKSQQTQEYMSKFRESLACTIQPT
jgi:hypothetical protein